MLEWHEWTANGELPPGDEWVLFAERNSPFEGERDWIVGTGYYLDGGIRGDTRLSRHPRDAWPAEMYWARFNVPD